jgi:hypothetical protein
MLAERTDGVPGGGAVLTALRQQWQRWPDLHELERFYGVGASVFR